MKATKDTLTRTDVRLPETVEDQIISKWLEGGTETYFESVKLSLRTRQALISLGYELEYMPGIYEVKVSWK